VLAGDAHTPATLHGYGPITAHTARALAEQGTIEGGTPRGTHPEPGTTRPTERAPNLADPLAEFLPPPPPPDQPDGTDPAALVDWCTDRTRTVSRPHPPPTRLLEEELALVATDTYAPSLRLRAKIVERDQTCRFPTCQIPAWRCQLDHIRPY